MKPEYQTDFGGLYNVDAIELMNDLQDNSKKAKLVFADPPYNIGKADWDVYESQEQYLNWITSWVSAVGDVLSNDGSLYLMGFSETLADIKCAIVNECDWFESIRWLVWHYRNKPQMSEAGWTRSHESILWIRKGEDYKFEMDRVRIPYNNHTEKYPVRDQGQSSLFGSEEGHTWDPNVEGAKPRDAIDVPTVNNASRERTSHPTQKPEELLRKIVWACSDRNELVLDPFGGSGTTFAVCEQLGRRWVGSEISEEYCDIIMDRLNRGKHLDDSSYWLKHDINRREHRREVRYKKD